MNDEWKVLAAAWKAEQPAVPADLARTVRRQGWLIRLNTAAALAMAASFLAGSLWSAIHFKSTEFVVLAIGVWMLTLSTTIFQLSNHAGIWTPESRTTDEFIRISLRRCQSSLRGVRFGLWLLLVEVPLLALWQVWYWSSRAERPAVGAWLLAALLPLAFLAALLLLRSHRRQELARLERIRRELSE